MKVRLKTIKQLLEEYPSAYFDECGDLICGLWKRDIVHHMFINFGQVITLDDNCEDRDGSSYCKEWIVGEIKEEPEVKKLYAWAGLEGQINWHTSEHILKGVMSLVEYNKRLPQFDIEVEK